MNKIGLMNEKKACKSVGLVDLIEFVKEDFVDEIIKPLLQKTLLIDCLIHKKNSKYEIDVIQDFNNDTFSLYDIYSKQLIILIDKDTKGNYVCKPFALMAMIGTKILEEYNQSILENKELKPTIYDDLIIFSSGDINGNIELSPYMFFLACILIHEFNLDVEKSTVCNYTKRSLTIDGMKKELMNDEKITTEDVIYMINISSSKKTFEVKKIYENNKQEKHKIDLKDFFLQYEYDLN